MRLKRTKAGENWTTAATMAQELAARLADLPASRPPDRVKRKGPPRAAV